MADEGEVSFFGIRYRIPKAEKPETVLAINLGGAETFDGIFLNGIVAVLLATILT